MKYLKKLVCITCFALYLFPAYGQLEELDSLKQLLHAERNDTMKLVLYGQLANSYTEIFPDSSLKYGELMAGLADSLGYMIEQATGLTLMGYAEINRGNYPKALRHLLDAETILEDEKAGSNIIPSHYPLTDEYAVRHSTGAAQRWERQSRNLQFLGVLYLNSNYPVKGKDYLVRSATMANSTNNLKLKFVTNLLLSRAYMAVSNYDSAKYSLRFAMDCALKADYPRYIGSAYLNLGRVFLRQNQTDSALDNIRRALLFSQQNNYFRGLAASNLELAMFHNRKGAVDSAVIYARAALPDAALLNDPGLNLRMYKELANIYRKLGEKDSVILYQTRVLTITDSLYGTKRIQEFQNIDFNEQQVQKERLIAEENYRDRIRTNRLWGGLGTLLLLALVLFWSNRQKQKAYTLVSTQKEETERLRNKAEKALEDLQSAQKQLVQSEKMASLGELTAGIAHEIQNPLNFVSNFSEINTELSDEIIAAASSGDLDEVKAIAKNIKNNQLKINEHGKRADGIVKSMLEHSRTSSGVKELTNLNALADEYLRLAYHGMRAKDKTFNAGFKMDFAPNLPLLPVVAQDMSRVLLNLFNNAFYAVHEKSKTTGKDYQPLVTVTTAFVNSESGMRNPELINAKSANAQMRNAIMLSISDNGNGIPDSIKDKIFQPFFTTKPTGQGTGLGLSLSYDIVKTQGGRLEMQSEPGKGAEFRILLPISLSSEKYNSNQA